VAYKIQDFELEYSGRTDNELLRLALASQDLVENAKVALETEMARRGLKAADIDVARYEDEKREEEVERETANRLIGLHWQGVGTSRFCKWERRYDAASGTEEFTTTVFFKLAWIPLIPLGTYRARRKSGLFQRTQVLEKVKLNWNQVLWVWMLTTLAMLALVLLVRFGLPVLSRR
jgi:hypothetical protein